MRIWSNRVEEDAWREKNCRTCFQPDEAIRRFAGTGPGCPLLVAASTGVLPPQWTRRRNAVMGETYRCSEYLRRPPVARRPTVEDRTMPMFDVEPTDCGLVPVDGWPERPVVGKPEEHQ